MENICKYFKSKKCGIYVVAATLILTLFTIIVFAAKYNPSYMSMTSLVFMVIMLIANGCLIAFKKEEFIPTVNALCTGLALFMFIYASYNYVVVVLTGIDIEEFAIEWILSCVGHVLMFGTAIASIFTPINSEKENA